MNGKNIGSWISGFLIGSAIGTGIALLKAPRSGDETREMLRSKGIELRDQANETYHVTRERAGSLLHDANATMRIRANRLKRVGREAIEDQRNLAAYTAEQAQDALLDES